MRLTPGSPPTCLGPKEDDLDLTPLCTATSDGIFTSQIQQTQNCHVQ